MTNPFLPINFHYCLLSHSFKMVVKRIKIVAILIRLFETKIPKYPIPFCALIPIIHPLFFISFWYLAILHLPPLLPAILILKQFMTQIFMILMKDNTWVLQFILQWYSCFLSFYLKYLYIFILLLSSLKFTASYHLHSYLKAILLAISNMYWMNCIWCLHFYNYFIYRQSIPFYYNQMQVLLVLYKQISCFFESRIRLTFLISYYFSFWISSILLQVIHLQFIKDYVKCQ